MRNHEVRTLDIAALARAEDIVATMKDVAEHEALSSTDGGIVWDVRCGAARDFPYLAELARGLGEGHAAVGDGSLGLILDQDIAMLVGRLITEELELTRDVVVLDGVTLHGVHFVDFGRYREQSDTVPVVLKSLLFTDWGNAS